MSFYFVPQLPRSVTLVAKVFMCKEKLAILVLLLFLLYNDKILFVNNESKQFKMKKNKMFTDIRIM